MQPKEILRFVWTNIKLDNYRGVKTESGGRVVEVVEKSRTEKFLKIAGR